MRRRQYGNPDGNQGVIIQALEAVGASVTITTGVGGGFVDLAVGFRRRNYLLEVKLPKGSLNAAEAKWHQTWRGEARVVHSPAEALEAIGVRNFNVAKTMAALGVLPEPQSGILAVPSHTAAECDDPGCRMHYKKKPKHKRIVILESPYAGRVAVNVEYARAALRDCVLRGEVPLASHLLYTQPGVLRDDVPEERELGINLGLELRRVAEASVVYEDLGVSEGMRLGIRDAEQHGRPVERRSLRGWEGR